jgi:hypothetical protein
MVENNRDFIERAASAAKKLHGEPPDVDKMVENFALFGLKKRAGILDSLDGELRGDIDSGPHNLRRRAQLIDLRRKMDSVHEALRKADR